MKKHLSLLLIKMLDQAVLKNYTQFHGSGSEFTFLNYKLDLLKHCEYNILCFTGSTSLCRGKQFIIHGNISKNSHECQRYIFGNRYYSFIMFFLFFKICLPGKFYFKFKLSLKLYFCKEL